MYVYILHLDSFLLRDPFSSSFFDVLHLKHLHSTLQEEQAAFGALLAWTLPEILCRHFK